jgi:hypothetical protein
MAIDIATDKWAEKGNTRRIREMAESILLAIHADLPALKLDKKLSLSTVMKWIKPFAPPAARKPGRPKKNK